MSKPKILILDIETSPLLSYTWGLYDQNVALNQIHKDWGVLSWAAKWYGDKKVLYMDQRNARNIENDKKILKGIWNLLDEAEIIVTQNGKRFDAKKLNARFVLHGFQPPSSYRHIDTVEIARKRFGFTSNKLAYLTDKLCTKYKKSEHQEFSGFELWKECLSGNKKAWRVMEKYNKLDVLALEELYEKLRPWDNSVNFGVFADVPTCSCGAEEFKKQGIFYSNAGKYQRFKCKACGKETRSNKNLLGAEARKGLRREIVR